MHTALIGLLERVWIKGQAGEMNIVVTPGQVSRELALIKKQSFGSKAEYHRFVRDLRFTRRDVRELVELQLLSTRIQRRILAGADGEAERRKVHDEFVAEFSERWRSRTVCAPEYVTKLCSNA